MKQRLHKEEEDLLPAAAYPTIWDTCQTDELRGALAAIRHVLEYLGRNERGRQELEDAEVLLVVALKLRYRSERFK